MSPIEPLEGNARAKMEPERQRSGEEPECNRTRIFCNSQLHVGLKQNKTSDAIVHVLHQLSEAISLVFVLKSGV